MRYLDIKVWQVPEFGDLELFRARSIQFAYARHSHAAYSIGVIEAGLGGNVYRGSAYLAPPQTVVVMMPDEVHTGYSAGELPLTYRMLYVSPESLQQIAGGEDARVLPYFRKPIIEDARLAAGVRHLHHILEASSDNLERESSLIETISALVYCYAAEQVPTGISSREQHVVAQIKDYLQAHLDSSITLAQLARHVQRNPSYLIRLFRKATGLSPFAYLTQIRVGRAKQLLSRGHPTADVAQAVGFADQSHLTRRFRAIVGVTPGRFQKMSAGASYRNL
jgi:AraC-like DNA-binding protein